MTNKKDTLFLDPAKIIDRFSFDADVAEVFDDMLNRSVPFYKEIQNMIVDMGKIFIRDGSAVYDLGCSTGTTLELLAGKLDSNNIYFKAIDNSASMLAKTKARLEKFERKYPVDYQNKNLNEDFGVNNSSFVILNLVLQFVDEQNRLPLIRSIYRGLNKGGAIILVEKVKGETEFTNSIYTDIYHNFKEQHGYSRTEILRKKESLENILIPYKVSENIELLNQSGFDKIEQFFQWYNFVGFLAVK